MHRILLTAGLFMVLGTLASSDRLVCYYDRNAATRSSTDQFTPANINPNLCTHIIFSFASIDRNTKKIVPVAASDINLYTELKNLKTTNPQLKTLLAVGGPGFDTAKFNVISASSNSRSDFINSVIALLQQYGFDGLNLDWRYPSERTRFTRLCQDLKTAFSSRSLLLTASVSGVKSVIDNGYEVALITPSLDFINILTFDFHAPSETVTAHHSPLGALSTNPNDRLTTQFAMNYWRSLGAPADKLNMGIAAYGVAFKLADPNVNGVGAATSGPAEEESSESTPGVWSYYKTCLYIQGGSVQWISDQSVPYAVTRGQWVGFDNTDSIDAKVAHIKANGYGGACVWALDLDDFTGQVCKAGANPFINYLSCKLAGSSTCSSNTNTGNSCSGESGIHANPADITTFCNCDHGVCTVMSCPAGLVFKTSCLCCDYP